MKKENITDVLIKTENETIEIHYKDGRIVTGNKHVVSTAPGSLIIKLSEQSTETGFHAVEFEKIAYVIIRAEGKDPRILD